MFEESRDNNKGGVMLVYIKDNLNPVQLTKPQIANTDASYIQFFLKNMRTVALIYRPPAQPVLTDQYIYEHTIEIIFSHEA